MFTNCIVAGSDDGKLLAVLENTTPCRLTIWGTETDTLKVAREDSLAYTAGATLQFSHDERRLAMTVGNSMTLYSCEDLTTVSQTGVPKHSEFGGVVVDSEQKESWIVSQRESRSNRVALYDHKVHRISFELFTECAPFALSIG